MITRIRCFWTSLIMRYRYWKIDRKHKRELKKLRKKDPFIYD